ncbi:hypothetical protein HMPREF9145_0420 [Segatella salivae F0493]|uniref:Uncharacterized protein n=1 Tax=Segatella salivae F0493 TaxID=1395125 RepID=U2KV92_9BACT|nr:hypothetical protein HMPREF9145_0420 [Segatella salivae F0493]
MPHPNKFFSFFAYQRIKYDAQCDIIHAIMQQKQDLTPYPMPSPFHSLNKQLPMVP